MAHHYAPGGFGEDIVLYSGRFGLSDHPDQLFNGQVALTFKSGTPAVIASGTQVAGDPDLSWLHDGPAAQMWRAGSEATFEPGGDPLARVGPDAAALEDGPWPRVGTPLQGCVGDGSALDRVTFLIANGWDSASGYPLIEGDPPTVWRGRTTAAADGWTITIDARPNLDLAEAEATGTALITHIGEVVRTDRTRFTATEAFDVLDRLRLAMTIATVRRVTTLVPVGWLDGAPVWSRWQPGRVDAYRKFGGFLDWSVASVQMTGLIERVLNATTDPGARDALTYATTYLTTAAGGVGSEFSVATCMSGLQLLAYYQLVTLVTPPPGQNQWRKKHLRGQVAELLDAMTVAPETPSHFKDLDALQPTTTMADGSSDPRNPLAAMVKIRDTVTHPGRTFSGSYTLEARAEAALVARRYLLLAILYVTGYRGVIANTNIEHPQGGGPGLSSKVPWSPDPDNSDEATG